MISAVDKIATKIISIEPKAMAAMLIIIACPALLLADTLLFCSKKDLTCKIIGIKYS